MMDDIFEMAQPCPLPVEFRIWSAGETLILKKVDEK